MMSANRLAPVALALLLVLAGCGGSAGDGTATTESTVDETMTTTGSTPPGTGEQTTAASVIEAGNHTTGTPESNGSEPGTPTESGVRVENGTLPVDANRTFARVNSLMGTDVSPRPVEVANLSEWRGTLPAIAAVPINDALGFENVSIDWSQPTGLTRVTGYVYVHPGEGSAAEIERALAHEFVHSVQFQAAMFPWLDELRTERVTTDEAKTLRALQEGGAVYVTDAYTQRYLDVQNNSAFAREYMSESPTHWSALAPYYFGNRYVADRIDSPANLSTVYENRPNTTEQIIHNYTRAEEPPAALAVETNATGTWEYARNDTLGELTTRSSLGTELNESRAATAAAGWGTDELVAFSNESADGQYGWVWVHRWDDAGEAAEAADAFDTYADRRSEASEYGFRLVRVSDETTAFVFGAPAFVSETTVSGTTGNVSVAVGS